MSSLNLGNMRTPEQKKKHAEYMKQYYQDHKDHEHKVRKQRRDKRTPEQRAIDDQRVKDWLIAHPDRAEEIKKKNFRLRGREYKSNALFRLYGITLDQYEEMLKSQNGVCKICGDPPQGGKTSTSSLHVDHNHVTGNVRALLCNRCNLAVGLLRDNPGLAEKTVEYLKEFK